MSDFTDLVDLASRRLGASVIGANDEGFAEKENLLEPQPAVFDPNAFGHRGKVMDGWETRRRREPGHDWAIVRLGAPGVVRGVVVDTSHFTGNYPEHASVEGCAVEGYPSPAELCGADVEWVELVPRSSLSGDSANRFAVDVESLVTHVRLNIFPDGGVARLRVHGEVVPDPRWLAGAPLDLAAQENGGVAVDASDRFYSSPHNLNTPGSPAHMGEGWETKRRRGEGNDWVALRLAGPAVVRQAVVDTTYFLHNAPGACSLSGCDASASDPADPGAWFELLPRTPLRPDTPHRFRLPDSGRRVTDVRIDVYPDGGLARLRLYGDLDPAGRAALALRWFNLLPAGAARRILTAEYGVAAAEADKAVAARPVATMDALPEPLRRALVA